MDTAGNHLLEQIDAADTADATPEMLDQLQKARQDIEGIYQPSRRVLDVSIVTLKSWQSVPASAGEPAISDEMPDEASDNEVREGGEDPADRSDREVATCTR